jgi:hypothetical protein
MATRAAQEMADGVGAAPAISSISSISTGDRVQLVVNAVVVRVQDPSTVPQVARLQDHASNHAPGHASNPRTSEVVVVPLSLPRRRRRMRFRHVQMAPITAACRCVCLASFVLFLAAAIVLIVACDQTIIVCGGV